MRLGMMVCMKASSFECLKGKFSLLIVDVWCVGGKVCGYVG
jgi:hypothetical protein